MEKISDYFANSDFGLNYIKILAPLTAEHMKIFMRELQEQKNIDYNKIGTEPEVKLKEISQLYGLLQTVFNDIETTLIFLKIKDKGKITEIYPDIENQEDYFAYHFENYIIRISSVSDVLSKLGNILYETKLNQRDCNGHRFRDKLSSIEPGKEEIINKLLLRIQDINNLRNKKVHTGERDIPYLEGVFFYTDLMNIIKKEANPIFEEFVSKDLDSSINYIEQETREIIDIVNEFLNNSVEKLLDISKPDENVKS